MPIEYNPKKPTPIPHAVTIVFFVLTLIGIAYISITLNEIKNIESGKVNTGQQR